MFQHITLRGGEGHITWGWHTAAVVTRWAIENTTPHWTLRAKVQRADPFQLRQGPLYFNAPRKGGYWCWPVTAVALEQTALTATLGQPER